MNLRFLFFLTAGFFLSFSSSGQFILTRLTVGSVYSSPQIKGLEGMERKSYTDGLLTLEGTYQFESKWGVVLDIGISNRGMTLTQPVTVSAFDPYTGDTTFSDKTNRYKHSFFYLDNTLMVRYIFGEKKTKAYVNAGIYYSKLLKARKLTVDEYYDYSGYGGISTIHNQYQDNTNYQFRGSDVGLAFGAGAQYGRFGLDIRYNLGLAEISKDKTVMELHHSFVALRVTAICFKSRSPLFRGDGLFGHKKYR